MRVLRSLSPPPGGASWRMPSVIASRDEPELTPCWGCGASPPLGEQWSTDPAYQLCCDCVSTRPRPSRGLAVLANAYETKHDFARALECHLSAIDRCQPGTDAWAESVCAAWAARRRAAPCRSSNIFCECERCASLPEKPWWMSSLAALSAMALHVVTAAPSPSAWRMHAITHEELGEWAAAARSWKRAAKICGLQPGGGHHKAVCLQSARACLEQARSGLKVAPKESPGARSPTSVVDKAKGSPTSVMDM